MHTYSQEDNDGALRTTLAYLGERLQQRSYRWKPTEQLACGQRQLETILLLPGSGARTCGTLSGGRASTVPLANAKYWTNLSFRQIIYKARGGTWTRGQKTKGDRHRWQSLPHLSYRRLRNPTTIHYFFSHANYVVTKVA